MLVLRVGAHSPSSPTDSLSKLLIFLSYVTVACSVSFARFQCLHRVIEVGQFLNYVFVFLCWFTHSEFFTVVVRRLELSFSRCKLLTTDHKFGFRRVWDFISTSLMRYFLLRDHEIQQRFLSLLSLFFTTENWTALLLRLSQVGVHMILVIRVGIVSVF